MLHLVVPIKRPSFETIALLERLLDQAQRGELRALAICAKCGNTHEEIAFAGDYRTHPAEGVNAAARMQYRLTQLQDDMEADTAQFKPSRL